MKKAIVFGAAGFIGGHLVKFLKDKGCFVRGVDIKEPEYKLATPDEFILGDLRVLDFMKQVLAEDFDEIYQFAADMGGAGYIFTGDNDAAIMHNSALINLNLLEQVKNYKNCKVFYASSACIYPEYNQLDPNKPNTAENSAYPAQPDSEYGWEKLFSERLYQAYEKNYGLDVRIARFHNVFGPYGPWNNGKEKAPSALCRKVALATNESAIEIWGDGLQTRSFLYIDECLDGIHKLMQSDYKKPLNIGSSEMVSINDLVSMLQEIANKKLVLKHISGPTGVRGRNSDNTLVQEVLNWQPNQALKFGLEKTYTWIAAQCKNLS